MPTRSERWFLRFARTADPRALARVFDATAPELWRVAAHLCRTREDAEDAVQATFLTAIEHAPRWDRGRPLLPWLLGILVNRVRTQRRSRRAIDAARVVERDEPDPARLAADREFGELVAAMIERVDEPFRTVLVQSLVHGESPAEIAARLAVPAATVRSRLHRGLRQLRQKLPAGAFAGAAVVPPSLPSQVAVVMRAKVLGGVPGGGVVARSVFGAVAVSQAVVMWCAAAALVTSLAYVFWPERTDPGSTTMAPVASGDQGRGPVAQSDGVAGAAPAARDPGASSEVVREAAPAATAAGTLHVLVRNAGNLEPIAGARVIVRREEPAAATTAAGTDVVPAATTEADAAVPREASGRTDDDGRVTLQLAAGKVRVVVGNTVPQPSYVVVRAGDETEHVHDAPVVFTADVKVVDAFDRPVAGAAIVGVRNPDLNTLVPEELGRTDADGRWRSLRTEPELPVRAVLAGLVASREGRLGTQQPAVELRLGGPAPLVLGTVRNASGAPVPGAFVAFVAAADPGSLQAVAADGDGRFRCNTLAVGRYRVIVIVPNPDQSCRRHLAAIDVAEHDNAPFDLQLPRGASVRVQLRRHDGSTSCGSASVRLTDELPSVLQHWFVRGEQTDGDGRALLDGLMPGRYRLRLLGPDQLHEQNVELRDGEQMVVEHTFASTAPLVVEVVDERGRPRAGLRVTLWRSFRDGVSATTNESGGVRFDGVAAGAHTIDLGANESRGMRWSSYEVDTRGANRIVAPSTLGTSVVRGTLVARSGELPKDLVIAVMRHDPDDAFSTDGAYPEVDVATGRFVADDLPPGRFTVIVMDRTSWLQVALRGPFDVPATGEVDLGLIELGHGELLVHLRAPFAVEEPLLSVGIDDDVFSPGAGERDGNTLRRPASAARTWRVLVWGENVEPKFTTATIGIDTVTEVAVDLVVGTPVRFQLPQSTGVLAFTLADGTAFSVYNVDDPQFVRGFPPGRHRVVFTAFDGTRAEAWFPVGDEPPETVVLTASERGR